MQVSELRKKLEEYNGVKGFWRRIWGDRREIRELAQFMNGDFFRNLADSDEVPIEAFLEEAPDLLPRNYLVSRVASARIIFLPWWNDSESRRENELIRQDKLEGVKNTTTFYAQDPIAEIPAERLIILDGYAFDTNELIEKMTFNLREGQNIYTNPHVLHEDPDNSRLFSNAAITQLEAIPAINEKIVQYRQRIENQRLLSAQVKEAFCDRLHQYLNRLLELGRTPAGGLSYTAGNMREREIAATALADYLSTLDKDGQQEINDFIIQVPITNSQHSESHTFAAIWTSRVTDCIVFQQIYLWMMLKKMRPDCEIPPEILNHPQARFYQMSGAVENQEQHELAALRQVQEQALPVQQQIDDASNEIFSMLVMLHAGREPQRAGDAHHRIHSFFVEVRNPLVLGDEQDANNLELDELLFRF